MSLRGLKEGSGRSLEVLRRKLGAQNRSPKGGRKIAKAIKFYHIIRRCITLGPLREKYGVPKERTRCGVGRRERDHQTDPGTAPMSTRRPQRGVPDPPPWPKWPK